MAKDNILVFHDRDDWPPTFVKRLNKFKEFRASLYKKPSECLERVKKGLGGVEVIILHKDISQYIPEEWGLGIDSDKIARAIHEEAEHVRVIVVSGEYPDGTKHVLRMGVDGYCNAMDVNSDWMIEQLKRGTVTPEEQSRRGVSVEMPPNISRHEKW